MKEQVNHPDHYKQEGRSECIVEMQDKYGSLITATFCLTNAYKYLYRAGMKDGNSREQDIEKAKWYYSYQNRVFDYDDFADLSLLRLREHIRKELEKYGSET